MKETLLAVTLLVGGGSGRCPSIRDHDDRMVCFAVTTRNASWCNFVRDGSKRTWCRLALGK